MYSVGEFHCVNDRKTTEQTGVYRNEKNNGIRTSDPALIAFGNLCCERCGPARKYRCARVSGSGADQQPKRCENCRDQHNLRQRKDGAGEHGMRQCGRIAVPIRHVDGHGISLLRLCGRDRTGVIVLHTDGRRKEHSDSGNVSR